MEFIVAAVNFAFARNLVDALVRAGAISSTPRVVSPEAAIATVSGREPTFPTIVFFCSETFSTSELATLKKLCGLRSKEVKVVAVGKLEHSDKILEVIRCGAIDYLDIQRGLPESLTAVCERIRAFERKASTSGKLFAVVSPVGGSGASFLACNLAAALAQQAQTCGLIDLHLRGGDLSQLLNVMPRHSLASLAGKIQHLDASMLEQSLINHECGVSLLAGPEPFSDYRQITVDAVQRILNLVRERFPFVVVDLEDLEHAEQLRTLAVAERVLILLRPDYVALSRCKRYLDHLTRAAVPREHVTVVVNRTGQPRELPLDCMSKALDHPLSHFIPNDPAAVSVSYNLGTPLVVSDGKSPAGQAVWRLARELLGGAVDGASMRSSSTPGPWGQKLRQWADSLLSRNVQPNTVTS